MKAMLLRLLVGCASLVCLAQAQTFPEKYQAQGQLILTHLESAPFPHPQRADGHKYKNEFFSAQEHYNDNTVAIFIPKGFRETGQIDFVVHFHGWNNCVTNVLTHYRLIDQMVASGRNAILVVPQGPRNAPDSFDGKLEDPGGFKRFMAEVAQNLRERSGLKRKDFTIGQIILSGHSGGYQVISSIVDCGGLSDQVKEVWLFDALYARTEKFLGWFDRQHGRLLDIYTAHGGTKQETEQLMATLKQRGTPFWAGKEADANLAGLPKDQPLFIFSELPHDEVVDQHSTFQQFLQTSGLEKR